MMLLILRNNSLGKINPSNIINYVRVFYQRMLKDASGYSIYDASVLWGGNYRGEISDGYSTDQNQTLGNIRPPGNQLENFCHLTEILMNFI